MINFFKIFLVIFFLSSNLFALENEERKLIESGISKDFLNIFVDSELEGLLSQFLEELVLKNRFIVNVKYVDKDFYKISPETKQHQGIFITKHEISENFKQNLMLDSIISLGKIKFSLCSINHNFQKIGDEIFENQDNSKKNLNIALNAIEKSSFNKEKTKIGVTKDQTQIKNNDYKNLEIIFYEDWMNLLSNLKKNEIDFGLLPNILCLKFNGENAKESLILENDNSDLSEYKIFFNNELSELILDKSNETLNQIFWKNK